MRRLDRATSISGVALLALLPRCAGTDFIDESFRPRVALSPAAVAVEIGEETTLAAIYFDDRGVPVPSTTFVWRSFDPSAAGVDSSG